ACPGVAIVIMAHDGQRTSTAPPRPTAEPPACAGGGGAGAGGVATGEGGACCCTASSGRRAVPPPATPCAGLPIKGRPPLLGRPVGARSPGRAGRRTLRRPEEDFRIRSGARRRRS